MSNPNKRDKKSHIHHTEIHCEQEVAERVVSHLDRSSLLDRVIHHHHHTPRSPYFFISQNYRKREAENNEKGKEAEQLGVVQTPTAWHSLLHFLPSAQAQEGGFL